LAQPSSSNRIISGQAIKIILRGTEHRLAVQIEVLSRDCHERIAHPIAAPLHLHAARATLSQSQAQRGNQAR
jgi:hypothetical protein